MISWSGMASVEWASTSVGVLSWVVEIARISFFAISLFIEVAGGLFVLFICECVYLVYFVLYVSYCAFLVIFLSSDCYCLCVVIVCLCVDVDCYVVSPF